MFYTKRKSYRGRWLVKLLQAALVLGVIFFGLDALGQWLNPETNMEAVMLQPILEEARNQENTLPPAVSEVANADMDAVDYFYAGLAHQEASEYNEAILDYTRSIELSDGIDASYLNRGVAYEQLGQNYRAIADFSRYMMRDGMVIMSEARVEESSQFVIGMSEGYRYDFPIELNVGDVLSVSVMSVEEDLVDPLIVLVNDNGNPVEGNDDVLRQDGTYISMNSYIHSYTVTRSGTYTLFVSHAGGGSYGDVEVSITIDN
jgi:hypothetical protein